MRVKFYLLLSFISIIQAIPALSQSTTAKLEKAEKLFDNKRIREALYEARNLIKEDPKAAKAYNLRGSCFVELNQLDSAEKDYKYAIRLDPSYPSPYYNLGNYYVNKGNYKAALNELKIYSLLKPQDISGWILLGNTFDDLKLPDSASTYYLKAYTIDSTNFSTLHFLGWNCLDRNNYSFAIKIAKQGQKIDSLSNNFYKLAGIGLLYSKKYAEASREFSQAIKITPDEVDNYILKARSLTLSNTSPDVLKEELPSAFKYISSRNMEELDSWSRDPHHKYFFENLLKKFINNPQSLGLDEYFMVYYGNALQKDFSSFDLNSSEIVSYLNKDEYLKSIREGEKQIALRPLNITNYLYMAIAHYNLKNYSEYEKYLIVYHSFISSLMATGDGKSFETSFLVTSPSDEYKIVDYLGFSSKEQSTHERKGHTYDIQHTINKENFRQDFYFSTDKHFDRLRKVLIGNSTPPSKKKRDRKSKKKKEKS